jgi:hypothetical protein
MALQMLFSLEGRNISPSMAAKSKTKETKENSLLKGVSELTH